MSDVDLVNLPFRAVVPIIHHCACKTLMCKAIHFYHSTT